MSEMIDLAVYNKEGQEVDSLKIDESALGGMVRYPLLKQAIVMYQANKRVGTAEQRVEVWLPVRAESSFGKRVREMPALVTSEPANVSAAALPLPRAPEISANVCLKSKED